MERNLESNHRLAQQRVPAKTTVAVLRPKRLPATGYPGPRRPCADWNRRGWRAAAGWTSCGRVVSCHLARSRVVRASARSPRV